MEVQFPGGNKNQTIDFKKLITQGVPILIIVLCISVISSLVYTVDPDEVGVVKRFGKYTVTTEPGLRFKLPWGIESVTKVRVQHYFKEEFGFRTKTSGVRSEYYGDNEQFTSGSSLMKLSSYVKRTGLSTQDMFLAESLMLTGDLNAADVDWIIQYTIKDPVAYAFNVRDMTGTIRNMTEAIMREIVGDATVDEVITYNKDFMETQVAERLQVVLDKLDTGVKVESIVLQDVNPPAQVKASFNEVNEARQDKERFINQAWQEYNRVIPQAQGEAEKMIQESEGYAVNRVNRATGEAERFLATWEEYKNAKEVTRKRMYIEAMSSVLPKLQRKIIMDKDEQGILPLLNLTQEGGN